MPRFARALLFFLALSIAAGCATSGSRRRLVCRSPRKDSLELSFTLATYRPGELKSACVPRLKTALEMGFTAVALSPSFIYDPESDSILSHLSVRKGEIRDCLNEALQLGFSIVYQPHLDSFDTIYGKGGGWRGDFRVKPDSRYHSELFAEFHAWLASKAKQLGANPRTVDVVISAELEQSLADHPREWRAYLSETRARIAQAGLAKKIRVAINPNWGPRREPRDCAAFAMLMHEADYLAVSFYGDWSQTQLGEAQVRARVQQFRDELGGARGGCRFNASTIPVSIGEVGVGGDFSKSQENVPVPASRELASDYLKKRRSWYEAILKWSQKAGPYFLNLWTVGVFDPVGIQPLKETRPDPKLKEDFWKYTERRCGKN